MGPSGRRGASSRPIELSILYAAIKKQCDNGWLKCTLAWRVMWLTMVNRVSSEQPAHLVFMEIEMTLLGKLVPEKDGSEKATVGGFLTLLARIGGYLNRKSDAPPGNMVLWRGMARLTDIHLGYCVARGDVGN